MSQNKIQQEAAALMARAVEMLAEAQGQLRLANRFPVEPEPFTVIQFDKEFPTSQAALESAGLSFDPQKLVPNLRPAGLEKLAEVVGYNQAVFALDEGTFAEMQRTSYRYVAIRIGDLWYTTAAKANKTMSWERLAEFIGDSPCWAVASWSEIPVEPPQVIEAADESREGSDAAAEATLAEVLSTNHKQVMEVLRKLRVNGGNPTPKTIVDALAKIGAEKK
jgi:hypothetical protein